jgi:hypothetical protein
MMLGVILYHTVSCTFQVPNFVLNSGLVDLTVVTDIIWSCCCVAMIRLQNGLSNQKSGRKSWKKKFMDPLDPFPLDTFIVAPEKIEPCLYVSRISIDDISLTFPGFQLFYLFGGCHR